MAGKRYKVELTAGAERDLEAIHDYIAEFDCVENANYVLDQLMSAVGRLEQFPERGSYPRELGSIGMREFRQAFFKPYRLIYRVFESKVVIFVIADGRRDMQALLARRLLGAA